MKIAIACDHAGYEYKEKLVAFLRQKGYEVKELHHENYRSRRGEQLNAHKKCIDGYHKQKLVSNNFYDVIYYINCHDSSMTRRWKEKSRIEKLFEMIDNQRIENTM